MDLDFFLPGYESVFSETRENFRHCFLYNSFILIYFYIVNTNRIDQYTGMSQTEVFHSLKKQTLHSGPHSQDREEEQEGYFDDYYPLHNEDGMINSMLKIKQSGMMGSEMSMMNSGPSSMNRRNKGLLGMSPGMMNMGSMMNEGPGMMMNDMGIMNDGSGMMNEGNGRMNIMNHGAAGRMAMMNEGPGYMNMMTDNPGLMESSGPGMKGMNSGVNNMMNTGFGMNSNPMMKSMISMMNSIPGMHFDGSFAGNADSLQLINQGF